MDTARWLPVKGGEDGWRWWLTEDSCTEPFSRMALMTSSSLLVLNSFSSELLGALSYAPCAPWLFAERCSSARGSDGGSIGGPLKGHRGELTCASRRS